MARNRREARPTDEEILSIELIQKFVIVTFMFAHIYLGSTGRKISTHFKMMITGWHEH